NGMYIMKKLTLSFVSIIVSLVITGVTLPLLATAQPNSNAQIPEVDGTYDEPGHPGVKVRVIVHRARGGNPAKPGGGNPSLVCSLSDPDSTTVVPAAGWKL